MKKTILIIAAVAVLCIFLNLIDTFKVEKPEKMPGLHGSENSPVYVIDYSGRSINSLFHLAGRTYTTYLTDIGYGTGDTTSGFNGGQYSEVQEGGWIAWNNGVLCYSPNCSSDKAAFYLCKYLSDYESIMTFEQALEYFE